ncbi:restriction endonuclease subunit S [Bacteroides thetaiotaomicron]|uniref:restriction endonuclease subunit S n=9 Tax=Bacteroidaceae TaxID=815 RepID=UPI0021664BE3|nr:restriction endonuclease subunit S [Bacteroides thetaiotaomicron]MCS3196144.1 restriction endonuclease subunit S [Bacteroides thetaiotaomicron]
MATDNKNKVLNVPHLRFPEFSGEWERKRLKDVCNIRTGNKNTQDKSDNGIYPFYVRSQIVERINSWTFDGEAILTAGDGVGVGKVFHYSTGKIGVHQRVYILSDFKCDGKYLYSYFAGNFYNRVKRMSAKNSVDSVRMEMIADMPIALPSIEEQKKIGHLLALLDDRITTQNKIIEDLKILKSAIIEKHYRCVKKHSVRVEELGKPFSVGNLSKDDLSEIGVPCIIYGELFTTYGAIINKVESHTKKIDGMTLSRKGDLLFPSSTTVDAVSLIAPSAINVDGVILGGDMFGIHVNSNFDAQYLSYFFNHIAKNQFAKYAKGSTIIHLHHTDIDKAKLLLPCLEEQNRMAMCMVSLDEKITIESAILKTMLIQKSYLLRQMFI